MQKLINRLKIDFPDLHFAPGQEFCWSPETGEIFYKVSARGTSATWSLLHETAHAILKHQNYQSDLELLRLEVEAWEQARTLAKHFSIEIDEDHIQDCLDTYRDWLYKRSICPTCTTKCLQQADFIHYRCFNCHKVWRVSSNRFGRAYRSTKHVPQPSTVFL